MKAKVLVTGASGQLGWSIKQISANYNEHEFIFMDSSELDITDSNEVNKAFIENKFQYCINCAAYTNVNEAEKSPEKAFAVNAEGIKNIALACKANGTILIHISTDYVFDGTKKSGYTVKDEPNPINVYGKSKLKGEEYIKDVLNKYFIVRTSWLYCKEYGNNFYRTILEKAKAGEKFYVTDQQRGCPTNTRNLANFILKDIIQSKNTNYGIHHFTDQEAMTWYDFAVKIFEENGFISNDKIVRDAKYRSFVNRPLNSILL